MAKEQVKEQVAKVDFVKAVKQATQAMGQSNFIRVNLQDKVTVDGLADLNEEYSAQGYEVFANGKSVLILKS